MRACCGGKKKAGRSLLPSKEGGRVLAQLEFELGVGGVEREHNSRSESQASPWAREGGDVGLDSLVGRVLACLA